MTRPIRVVLADDHRFFRDGVRLVLDAAPDIEVVGEAETGEEAIARTEATQPDAVVMDVSMPGVNGIEATRRLLRSQPNLQVLVLTMHEDDDLVFAAMRAGARGYLLKNTSPDELLRAIRAVANGEAIFGPAIARRLVDYFARPLAVIPAPMFPDLTERERDVLDLIAKGQNNEAIAAQLVLSMKTVRNYVSSILSKLQVADRSQAIVRARDAGLGQNGT
ncbi:MAG: response regulator transcription factor [Chloroflexi bacterium]|nr:MAG: response regulator transcription factor [Chloroflexota bacterium]